MAAAILAAFGARAHAQSRPAPLSLDATLGGGWGDGGQRVRGRGFIALDATAAAGLRRVGDGGLVVAMAGALQAAPPHGDDCIIDAQLPNRCLPDYPTFVSLGALVGWEQAGVAGTPRWLSTRLLAGPAYYRVNLHEVIERTRGAFGVQARLDLAAPAGAHLAFVTSLRAALVPDVGNDAYITRTIGVGVRVQ